MWDWIYVRGFDSCQEELRAISIGTSIRGAENPWASVRQLEVLVRKSFAVDRPASCAISSGEIAPLDHKVFDDTMKFRALVTKALSMKSKLLEIASCLRNDSTTGKHQIRSR